MRKLENNDLIGKTIESLDNSSVNVIRLKFTDGTTLELWSEIEIHTPHGDIPGFFVNKN